MTDYTTHTQTLTNGNNATIVSPIDPSGSPKNELLKSFKSGKFRKNAKKKIADLLSIATQIELQTQSMNYYDDTYDYNEAKLITIDEFWAWYEEKYDHLDIYLNGKKDELIQSVTFSDCPYHFSNDIVLTFNDKQKEVKEVQEIEEVDQFVVVATNANVDTENLEEIKIVSIEILWSESNYFKDNEILTLEAYNEKATQEAIEIGYDNGYAKTKIIINQTNGDTLEHRHDITAKYPTLNIDLAYCGLNAIDATLINNIKPKCTHEAVIEALKQGYISPLNSDKKRPEPTPPTDKKTRSVVSFGDYQDRLESKRERLEDRAEKANQQSNAFYESSKSLADMIPFGQPILIGHHSENRSRKHHEKIFNDMGKSVAAGNKADYLANKAANLGCNGIASDDPEAIKKLKIMLESLQNSQEVMKSINKVIRSNHLNDTEKLEYMIQTHKLKEADANQTLKDRGFASYSLSNNNATINNTKERIKDLEALHNQEPLHDEGEVEGLTWELYEEDGRIKFSFNDKPSENLRGTLKSNGFRWSRYSAAWVRKITPCAVIVAKNLSEKFKE
jgi:hypothetical protein